MVIQVGINGFGRIGRIMFRTCVQNPNVEVRAINDPAIDVEYICYLIKFDSTHGNFNEDIIPFNDDIKVNGNLIKIFREKLPSSVPWHIAGVQYVIESSGMFTNYEKAVGHLASEGVKRVVVTAPSADVPMLIIGVNNEESKPDEKVISSASSTLYCLAAIVKVLEKNFGVAEGFVTSIHAMTPSLKPLDGLCLRGKHWRDYRSIHQNIIPATTGACKALGKVMPQLKDKLVGLAFRVPIVNVSVLDLTVRLNKDTSLKKIVESVEIASKTYLKGVLNISNEETVSSDFMRDSHSCILDVKSSIQHKPNFYKIICWYENEFSYACRVIDTILFSEKQLSRAQIAQLKNNNLIIKNKHIIQHSPEHFRHLMTLGSDCTTKALPDVLENVSRAFEFKINSVSPCIPFRKKTPKKKVSVMNQTAFTFGSNKSKSDIYKIVDYDSVPASQCLDKNDNESCFTLKLIKSNPNEEIREGKGIEGKGKEGKGIEGKGIEGKGIEGKGIEGKGIEGKGIEGKGVEGKGIEGKGIEGKGIEGKGREHKVNDHLIKAQKEVNRMIKVTQELMKKSNVIGIDKYKERDSSKLDNAKVKDHTVDRAKVNKDNLDSVKVKEHAVDIKKTKKDDVEIAKMNEDVEVGEKVKKDAVDSANFKGDVVDSSKVKEDAIDNAKVIEDPVNNAKPKTDAVGNANIKVDAVNSGKVKEHAVKNAKDKKDTMDSAKVIEDAVDSAKVKEDAVNNAKVKEDAVESAKVKEDAIDNAKVRGDTLDNGNAKVKEGAIENAKYKEGSMQNAKFYEGTTQYATDKKGLLQHIHVKGATQNAKLKEAETQNVKLQDCTSILQFHKVNVEVKEAATQNENVKGSTMQRAKLKEAATQNTNVKEYFMPDGKIKETLQNKTTSTVLQETNSESIEKIILTYSNTDQESDSVNESSEEESSDIDICDIISDVNVHTVAKPKTFGGDPELSNEDQSPNDSCEEDGRNILKRLLSQRRFSIDPDSDTSIEKSDTDSKEDDCKKSVKVGTITNCKGYIYIAKQLQNNTAEYTTKYVIAGNIEEAEKEKGKSKIFRHNYQSALDSQNMSLKKKLSGESVQLELRYDEKTSSIKGYINKMGQDIYDKLDSASATNSENSFDVNEKKSQVIRINDLTDSLEDLGRLEKICKIIEISDDLSDILFGKLKVNDGKEVKNKKWSFKDLCEKINLDDFCSKLFHESNI